MKKRNRVLKKIDNAYDEFRCGMIRHDSNDVYDFAYKIHCIEEIYTILINGYPFDEAAVKAILNFKGNILEQIYSEWLDVDVTEENIFADISETAFKNLGKAA